MPLWVKISQCNCAFCFSLKSFFFILAFKNLFYFLNRLLAVRTRINLGSTLTWFLVFCVRNPGRPPNGSRLHPYLWVQNEVILIGKNTQKSTACPSEFLRQFLCHSPFHFPWQLKYIDPLSFSNDLVSRLVAPSFFFVIVFSTAASFLFHSVASFEKENFRTAFRIETTFHF